jgi:tetratricopeptide (TPR) repeat protein
MPSATRWSATVVTEALGLSTYDISALVKLVNQERLGEAEHSARTLLKAYPGAGMLWKILSVAQLRQGKDALPALRKTAELMPLDAEAHRNLGAALHDQGQWALALESFRRALELAPNDADCLVEAADALRALGRAREAVSLYQQALQHDPTHVEAQNNLGNAFLQLAQFAEAAACYRLALRLRPADVQILCNLGHVLRELGQRREAVPLYTQAIKLDPRRYDVHWNLGTVLFELRRFREAVACFTQAIKLKPDYAPAHLSMGLAMRQQRRPAEAEASCQAALAIDPNYVEALSFLGELRADRGRFEEAEELFRRTIAINPNFSFSYFSIATHRKMSTADSAWLQGVETLLARQPPLAHEISLRYGLGKYFDDVGQYASAFENYRQANELTKRYGSSYDREKLTQRVDQIMHCFDAAFVRDPPNQGSSSELPVLIVGMPRSGTSLTEQILASHPAVFGAGEVPFWDGAFNVYQKAALSGPVDPTLLPGMAAAYLERFAAASAGVLRVVDKLPGNFLYAGMIHSAFPRARIIHMQRHPLDTCLSIYFQNFFGMGPYANDLDNLAHYYGEYLRITNHWRAVLPATVLLEVPYEALIEDQEGWSRKMVEFIGLSWDPKCLDFHQTERAVITASKWQVRQKIHSASAGRWRHYEKFVGPLRAALGDVVKP